MLTVLVGLVESGKRYFVFLILPRLPNPAIGLPLDEEVASVTAENLLNILAHLNHEDQQTRISAEASDAVTIRQSANRIRDNVEVVQALEFKIGALAWKYLYKALCQSTTSGLKSHLCAIMKQTADIATLIARYNVMESMYRQWSNMSLGEDSENSLIDPGVNVLRYFSSLWS